MDALNRNRHLLVFAVPAWGFLLSMFHRVSVTVLNEDLSRDLGLGPRELGALSSGFFYAFALAQIPLGIALDRMGTRRTLTGLGLLASLATFLFGLARGPDSALLARVLLGLGMAGNLMGAMTLIAAWFPASRFATLSGITVAIGSSGLLLASSPLALLAQALGWRGAFFLAAAVNLLQTIVLFLTVRDRPPGAPTPRHSASPWADLLRLLKAPYYWLISFGAFARFGAYMAIHSLWAGPFLMQGLGWSQLAAGNALLAMSLGYIVGQPLAGRLSDRLPRRRNLITVSLLCQSALIGSFILWPRNISLAAAMPLFFLLALAASPGQTMYAHIKELLPREMTGLAITGINFFNMLGPAVFIHFSGLLAPSPATAAGNPATFAPVWLCLGLPLLLATAGYALTPEGSRRNPPPGGRQ